MEYRANLLKCSIFWADVMINTLCIVMFSIDESFDIWTLVAALIINNGIFGYVVYNSLYWIVLTSKSLVVRNELNGSFKREYLFTDIVNIEINFAYKAGNTIHITMRHGTDHWCIETISKDDRLKLDAEIKKII